MNSKQALSRKTLAMSLVALTAAAASAVPAGNVTWTWNCESAVPYADYIATGSVYANSVIGASVNSGSGNVNQYSIVTGESGTAKSGSEFIKVMPVVPEGNDKYHANNFATVSITGEAAELDATICESYTFSFDYAPSYGENKQSYVSFGLAVHDGNGTAIASLYSDRSVDNPVVAIYKGGSATDDSRLWSGGHSNYSTDRRSSPESSAKWYHFTFHGDVANGVTMSVTYAGETIVDSQVVSQELLVPSKILLRVGCYSSRQSWACLDDFAFSATTIYKKKYTKSADYKFENDADQAILTNGFVTSTLLGTTAMINDSVNWSAVTGEASPKSREKFAQISLVNSNNQVGRAGLLVEMPPDVTKAAEYVLEFDVLVMSGYSVADTNGFAIVGKNGVLATMLNGYNSSVLYKGDSEENPLASEIAVTGYNNNAPASTQCIWHHCIVRGDAESGVRFSMTRKDTREEIVQNVRLGDFDNVTKIALCASIHGQRTIYACIDNVEAYTFRQKGLVIRFL